MTTTQERERVTVSTRIELTALEARQVAAIAKAASTDDMRPILCAILIEAGDLNAQLQQVKFTATDSYVLAQRTIEVEVSEYSSQNHVTDDLSVMVEAKAFAKALDRHGIDFKKHDNVRIVVTVDGETVTVSATANQSATFTIPIVDGTFPNYTKLIPSPDSFKPTSLDALPTEWGFNPKRIVQCLEASGYKIPGARQDDDPVIWKFGMAKHGELKPAYFTTRIAGEGGFWGLIMPIRL